MCFSDPPEPPPPPKPPEVLEQAAPKKKTAAQPSSSGMLAIGTKKYRRDTGIGSLGTKSSPTGINLA